jgi:4-amino-4-deoxy-L-arabinose transferase-like glycosyltransferase
MPSRSILPFLIAFLVLRVVFWFTTFPNPDEAYYWLWGQHPDLSYYDHPPLQAWVQGGLTAIFGRSKFVLRLPNLISNGIFFYTYYRIAVYLYGQDAHRHFWITVMLVLASPLYFLFLALAWHDHLLITFSLISAYLFVQFLDGYLVDGKGESWRLYGSAGAIALAGICKYNAVFVVLGLVAAVVTNKQLRPLGRDRRIYLAGAIAASALIPILLWNVFNDFQSFHYYVDRSVNTGSFSLKVGPCLNFLLFSFLLVSPLNWIGFFRVWKQSQFRHFHSTYASVAFWVFLISTITLTIISLLSAALYYWNITAYLLLFPLVPSFFLPANRTSQTAKLSLSPLFWSGQFYGLLFAALLVVHYSVLPISALFSHDEDPDSRMLFGWDKVAAVVKAEAAATGSNPFLVTTDYRSASALAFQLNDRNVMAISDRVDQFDFWYTDDREFKGRNAVILSDDWHPIQPKLLAQFEQISPPTKVSVTRLGVWIKNYSVFKGYRFKGGKVASAF